MTSPSLLSFLFFFYNKELDFDIKAVHIFFSDFCFIQILHFFLHIVQSLKILLSSRHSSKSRDFSSTRTPRPNIQVCFDIKEIDAPEIAEDIQVTFTLQLPRYAR